MTRMICALALGALLATPLAAQDPVIAARMAGTKGDGSPYDQACKLSPGHFLVSSGGTYLQTAMKTSQVDNRSRALRDGKRVLLQSITQSAQDKNPAAWYYLGRIDLMLGDMAGADSSLARTAALYPACAAEVEIVRGDAVRSLAIPASDFQTAGKLDSAMYLYRASRAIDPGKPFVNYQMAEIFKGQGQTDSAIAYYERAIASATDTTANARQIRGNAGYTVGLLYYNAQRYADAIHGFHVAVDANPKDQDAVKNLSIAFRAAGMADSAKALDDEILKEAQASGTVTPDQLFDLGVAQFNEKKFADAAISFQKVIAAAPYRHDAWLNLASSYSAMDSLTPSASFAGRVVAAEPLNYDATALLGRDYKRIEDALKSEAHVPSKTPGRSFDVFSRLFAMTVSLDAVGLTVEGDNATLKLSARGRPGIDPSGHALTPAGVSVVVQFLDDSGKVVASAPLAVPALQPDSTRDLTASATGKGITGWSYRKT